MNSATRQQSTIRWPQDDHIIRMPQRRATATAIQNLFSNTGIIVSILFILVKQVIQPSLESHFSQRVGLSASTLLQVRRLVATLKGMLVYTPISSIGFDGTNGEVERSTQTSEDDHKLLEGRENRWGKFNDKLKEANEHLQRYNTAAISSSKNMDSFQFQMKLVVDEIQLNEDADKASERCRKIVDSVRELKGWFVNGRFH